jgi:hypothetical protein
MSGILPWLIALCGIAVLLSPHVVRSRTARIRRLAAAADQFFEEVDLLLEDADAPAAALNLLGFLNRQIANRTMARQIFFSLLFRRAFREARPSAALEEVMSYYLNTRKDLAKHFAGACVAAIFAMSYQSPVFGFLLRRLVFFDLNRHQDRAPDVVASLRASGIGDRGHCAAPA